MIEWTWIAVSVFALVVTVFNLSDAFGSWKVLRGSGKVREYAAQSNVRREAVRVPICAALIVVVAPSLLREGDIPLSPFVLIAMAIPVGMALNSYLDRRTRRTVDRMLAVVDGP